MDPEFAEGEEARGGSSPRQRQVSTVLADLAKTARSFLLYDARNNAIHHFLTALLANITSTLENGPIVLNIQPFEMWHEGESVYLNRDRERSLAFRLYRDGVRGLTFRPGFHWEEMAKLLEILSIRYTGIHQNEDDVVTLLWKANFRYLEVVAVEGFVPEDEQTELEGSQSYSPVSSSSENTVVLPDYIDLPPPHLPGRAQPLWTTVSPERMQRLRDEVSAQALPEECLQLLWHLVKELGSFDIRWRFSEVSHLFTEVRDFLQSAEHLFALEVFIELLAELEAQDPPSWDQGRRAPIADLRRSCGDVQAVRKLLHTIPVEQRKLDPEMIRVLDRLTSDPLTAVLDAMGGEMRPGSRAIARQLIEHFGADRLEELEARFRVCTGHMAQDLLRVIAHIGGERAASFIALQCSNPDDAVQDEAMRHIRLMPYSGSVGRTLFDAFRAASSERRLPLLELIVYTGDRRFVDQLARFIEQGNNQLSLDDAEHIGRALGKLGGEQALSRWIEWLRPTGWLRKTLPGSLNRQVAAAAALAEVPSEDAEKALREALMVARDAAQRHIGQALSRQHALPKGTSP